VSNKRTKKLMLHVQYATLDLQEVLEIFEEYRKIFELEFQRELQYLSHINKPKPFPSIPNIKRVKPTGENEIPDRPDIPKEINKIYRDIAKVSHPDICHNEDKISAFKRASNAHIEGDLLELLLVCDELNIGMPELSEETQAIILQHINKCNDKIHNVKQRAAWVWGENHQDSYLELRDKMLEALKVNKSKFNEWLSAQHQSG
jgi:hypothetical protein